jgi:hypothetical protein
LLFLAVQFQSAFRLVRSRSAADQEGRFSIFRSGYEGVRSSFLGSDQDGRDLVDQDSQAKLDASGRLVEILKQTNAEI